MTSDEYYGNNLNTNTYDKLPLIKIPEKILSKEPNLFEKKWFDYRTLHPTQATYLFFENYREAFRKAYSVMIDRDESKYIQPVKNPAIKKEKTLLAKYKKEREEESRHLRELSAEHSNEEIEAYKREISARIKQENRELKRMRENRSSLDIMTIRDALSFWKGRQSADELGIPYNLYCGYAMRFLIRKKIWKRIPRPCHLYGEETIDYCQSQWAEQLSIDIITPKTAHLSNDNSYDVTLREDIERWLCERIKTRRSSHFGLSRFMFEEKLLSEKIALQYFNVETVNEASAYYLRTQE